MADLKMTGGYHTVSRGVSLGVDTTAFYVDTTAFYNEAVRDAISEMSPQNIRQVISRV